MNQRRPFISVATFVSLLLPLAAIAERAAFSFTGYWWFAYPAQLLIAGLFGLVVAISRRGWWWLLGGCPLPTEAGHPGPRIGGASPKPDDHQRIVFQPTNLLAAIWLQFARAVTEEYPLRICEGCGEYFQVGPGRRAHTKTCKDRCRQRACRQRKNRKAIAAATIRESARIDL
jgi:hypothetical protein